MRSKTENLHFGEDALTVRELKLYTHHYKARDRGQACVSISSFWSSSQKATSNSIWGQQFYSSSIRTTLFNLNHLTNILPLYIRVGLNFHCLILQNRDTSIALNTHKMRSAGLLLFFFFFSE